VSRLIGVPTDCVEPPTLTAAIRARRGGHLLNLDRTLLLSIPLAGAWNDYLAAIRGSLSVEPRLREIAICGVAILNGAEYEFLRHEPEFRRAGGTALAAQRLREFSTATAYPEIFNEAERAVIALTTQMTNNIDVDDETWQELKTALPNPQAQVEIVAIVATYNMVSRFLIACQIKPEAEPQPLDAYD
jgi:alkylhydroperoxidase family enzyme